MVEARLRTSVGLFLIVTHFGAIVLLIVLHLMGGFLFEEMTTALALVGPLFAGYTTLIMKYLVASRHVLTPIQQPVTSAFVFLSFLTPALFVLLLYAMIVLKAFNIGFASFDQFKIMLGVVETGFAVYMGQIVSAMFSHDGSRKANNGRNHPPPHSGSESM